MEKLKQLKTLINKHTSKNAEPLTENIVLQLVAEHEATIEKMKAYINHLSAASKRLTSENNQFREDIHQLKSYVQWKNEQAIQNGTLVTEFD